MPIMLLIDGHWMSALEENAHSLRSGTLVLIGGAVSNACMGGPG
jgi:predicted metalloprotease